jgi:general secretion pathway protein D
VTFLTSPRVTTRSGQRAVIEIIREFRYPVWEENGVKVKKGEGPVEFQTMNLGATMEVEPKVSKEGLVDLRVTPTVTECLGMVDIDTGKAVLPLRPRPQDGVEPTFPSRVSFPKAAKGQRQKPVFSRRQTTTDLTMPLGHILVLTNLREREKTQPFNGKEPEVRLMVVVRVEEIEDADEPSSRSVNVFPVPPVAPKAQP